MDRPLRCFLLLLMAAAVSGCASSYTAYEESMRVTPEAARTHARSYFASAASPNPVPIGTASDNPIVITKMEMPSVTEGMVTRAEYWQSFENPKCLVVVLSIFGSLHRYPQERISRELTERGVCNILLIRDDDNPIRLHMVTHARTEKAFKGAVRATASRMRDQVADINRWVSWALDQPDAPKCAGIIGFSFSAMHAVTAMGIEKRICAGVFMMGGGKFSETFARYRDVQDAADPFVVARRSVLWRFGWTRERLAREVEDEFRVIEPTVYARFIDPKQVLLFEAAYDQMMPRQSREALVEALGFPERYTLYARHRTAFYTITPLQFLFGLDAIEVIVMFFRTKLK